MNNNTSKALSGFVQVPHHNIALLFSNYLMSLHIDSDVKANGNEFVIYCDESKIDESKKIFEIFIKEPHHPKYQQAAWSNGEVTQIKEHGPSFYTTFKAQFLQHAGIVTLTVFTLCWIVFILSQMGWQRNIFDSISFYVHFTINNFLEYPYRLIGPAFFHFTWLHIVFNTMWWWQLGGTIERELGKGALINLLLISAIISNTAQFLVSGPSFGGLSGVVYALFGYVWWYGWLAPEKGMSLSKPVIGILLFFMLLGFAEALPMNMANTAHLFGLISGCGLAWFKIKHTNNNTQQA